MKQFLLIFVFVIVRYIIVVTGIVSCITFIALIVVCTNVIMFIVSGIIFFIFIITGRGVNITVLPNVVVFSCIISVVVPIGHRSQFGVIHRPLVEALYFHPCWVECTPLSSSTTQ